MKQKTIGYLRVSTIDQDTDKFETDILRFANDRGLGKVKFVSEKVSGKKSWKKRRLKQIVEDMQAGDVMIVPELSRLGRSIVDIFDLINELDTKGVKIYSVKENFHINGKDITSKVMRTMFTLMAELENDLRSLRTREGIDQAKKRGVRIGRPKGVYTSSLDPYRTDIEEDLRRGVTKRTIAARYGVTPVALWQFLKRRNIQIEVQL